MKHKRINNYEEAKPRRRQDEMKNKTGTKGNKREQKGTKGNKKGMKMEKKGTKRE
jgi:hypothetical protein